MPYVEVWVDPTAFDPEQIRAVRDLVSIGRRALAFLPSPEEDEMRRAIARATDQCLLDEVTIDPYPIDMKYAKWLAERNVVAGSAE